VTKLTTEQAKAATQGQEPSCGGYGSELRYEDHEDGVVLTLLADWAPRHSEPQALLTALTDGHENRPAEVTFRWPDHHGGWEAEETRDLPGLLAHLADQASEGG